jgi:hypothetical protein
MEMVLVSAKLALACHTDNYFSLCRINGPLSTETEKNIFNSFSFALKKLGNQLKTFFVDSPLESWISAT